MTQKRGEIKKMEYNVEKCFVVRIFAKTTALCFLYESLQSGLKLPQIWPNMTKDYEKTSERTNMARW